jgi:hypothetical protein
LADRYEDETMTRKWIIVAEEGLQGNAEFSYSPRFGPFDSEAAAQAVSKRLNQAATSTYTLTLLPPQRRGSNHTDLAQAALDVLQSLDPHASSTVNYSVRYIDSFEPSVEGPPASPAHALFRAVRDLPPPPPPSPPPPAPEPEP